MLADGRAAAGLRAELSEGAPPLSKPMRCAGAVPASPVAQAQAEIEGPGGCRAGRGLRRLLAAAAGESVRQSTTTLSTRSGQRRSTRPVTARSLALERRLFDFGTALVRDGAQRLLAAAGAARDALVQRLMAALVSPISRRSPRRRW